MFIFNLGCFFWICSVGGLFGLMLFFFGCMEGSLNGMKLLLIKIRLFGGVSGKIIFECCVSEIGIIFFGRSLWKIVIVVFIILWICNGNYFMFKILID